MELNDFLVDKELSVNGVWFDVGGGTKFLIAKGGNRLFVAELARLNATVGKDSVMSGDIPDTLEAWAEKEGNDRECLLRAMASTILLGWEGLTESGQDVEYSVETAHRILDSAPSLLNIVSDKCMDDDKYRPELAPTDSDKKK